MSSDTEFTRLHITPLNPNLLSTIIPPSVLPNARNISYHTIETFPEKGYGFVDLPAMDADKLKKKLNGSILKGTKIRIEKARPAVDLTPVAEPDEPAKPQKERKDPSKKRKRGEETIPAVELTDRKVKRGWTTPAATIGKMKKEQKELKKVVKSKFTTTEVAANAKGTEAVKTKQKSKKGKDAVVHEFAKSTKFATFLRTSGGSGGGRGKSVKDFVDGKGWVDEDGNVVEEVKPKKQKTKESATDSSSESDSSSKDDSSSEGESSDGEEEKLPTKTIEHQDSSSESDSDTDDSSSSDSHTVDAASDNSPDASSSDSSESESDSDSDSSSDDEPTMSSPSKPSTVQPAPINTTISSPETSPIQEIHPLEALYKRPKPDSTTTTEANPVSSFSFFGPDADSDMEDAGAGEEQYPLTPFSKRDIEYRAIRSAAPTPDTAYANKRFVWPTDEDSPSAYGGKGKGKGGDEGEGDAVKGSKGAESDFQKWFYEHRGESTRGWKKRRRAAAKEVRHRENKKGRRS
ncbi:suppressor srp40 protein [Rutstroemia sp. NJR-2017a BBW]|nr:suppressor srp40 protein [Rutstroemia sp. NJR-2017a BBW]